MDKELLHILQHSLGLDGYGRGARYRNHFCTGPGSKDFDNCQTLVEQGMMVDHGSRKMFGGDHLFEVTPAGDDAVRDHSPRPPKLTRSQKHYQQYLDVADCFDDFRHFLLYTAARKREALVA